MKNIYLIVLAIVVIGALVFYAVPAKKNTYVRDITTQIEELESELETLEADTNFGELTPELAVEKQAVIVEKLARIQSLINAAPSSSLSKAKYVELQNSLKRLAGSLSQYSDSLVQLDTVASRASAEVKERIMGRTMRGVNSVVNRGIADTIEAVNEHLEDISTEPIEDEISEIVEETLEAINENIEEIEESIDDMMGDDGGAAGTMPEGTEVDWDDTPTDEDGGISTSGTEDEILEQQ